MFKKTIEELQRCLKDARLFSYFSTLITQCFFIVYYILALCLSFGYAGVYATLLALTVAAFIFFLCTESPREKSAEKGQKWVRISVRYAKFCVHIVAISLTLYAIYVAQPREISALSLILLVFAVLALIIQIIGELVGFLARRYFRNLLDAAIEESEFLRSVLGKVQSGAESIREMKEKITSLPKRTVDAASGIKGKITDFFHRKKDEPEEALYDDKTDTEIHS